jgi:hypothetical protein
MRAYGRRRRIASLDAPFIPFRTERAAAFAIGRGGRRDRRSGIVGVAYEPD